MLPSPIIRAAAVQHGLVSRADCCEHVTARRIERAVARGELEIVRPAVYRVAGAPGTQEQRLLAAVLSAGPGAAASHRAAAWLYGLEGFPAQVLEVTTPRNRRVRLAGIKAHQTTVLGIRHTTTVRGVPVTTASRTVCDLSGVLPLGRLARVLDEALRRDLLTLALVTTTWMDLKTRGRRRSRAIGLLLAERYEGAQAGDSPPERWVAQLLIDAGLGRPEQQYVVTFAGRRIRFDLAYPEHRIAIEYDGWAFHNSRTAFDSDRERDNAARIGDWIPLRFTSKSSADTIVSTVAAAIASRCQRATESVG